jgi:hypothetical protein
MLGCCRRVSLASAASTPTSQVEYARNSHTINGRSVALAMAYHRQQAVDAAIS